MAHDEMRSLDARRRDGLKGTSKFCLSPKTQNDEKNVIVEIRAGTGGDEASLFAGQLFRMYSRYAETQGWRVEILEGSSSSIGGMKEIVAAIQGSKVYSKLKYRKWRAPRPARSCHRTARPHSYLRGYSRRAARGRRHRHQDRGQRPAHRYILFLGAGRAIRQHDLFGRSHHPHSKRPGGFTARRKISNQKPREGHARSPYPALLRMEQEKQHQAIAAERRGQIKTGDRSEKIRTYNYRDNRVTDHRINFTLHQLTEVMDGKLGPLVDALVTHFESERLKQELVDA